ncbi:hypothetical protein [Fodinibius sp.]|uniref:hypothetical protein n=1 Tax=Fodinibius sp. TaxID=1872440 RepID=UPI002ACD6E5F|nr:hypothetical protein [Fodinibius sp.]MDZ7660059.1 hypothetical protein [Fodinibius sp.]
MSRKYYASRKGNNSLSNIDLYERFVDTFNYFKRDDYFIEYLGVTPNNISEKAKYLSSISLNNQIFPVEEWSRKMKLNEDLILSCIEFLYDNISKPGEPITETMGFSEYVVDYRSYNQKAAQEVFREKVNIFLADYAEGYELNEEGEIVEIGGEGLRHILNAEIPEYDFDNVDLRVKEAIHIWKSRNADISDKKEAINKLADVFEWLKKNDELDKVLNNKDENALFHIVNKFAIRHHNPDQKDNYDENIWYSWMFHFYLASYHAAIRLLKREEEEI